MESGKLLIVYVFTPERIREIGAGDWMQARKTYEALRSLGFAVDHIIFRDLAHLHGILSLRKRHHEPDPWKADVWHFIPGRLSRKAWASLSAGVSRRPLLAGSSILWVSRIHERVILRNNSHRPAVARMKFWIKRLWRPKLKYLEAFDLILPNSRAEAVVCRRYARLKRDSLVCAVPNAIDAIPEWAADCPAPPGLGRDGYIVYPGVFSPRKNQWGFIRAMGAMAYPVVFMGGPPDLRVSMEYYERCRKEAPPHFRFLGQVPHGSREFYGVLGNARVACLSSSCETPGLALLEGAALGVRPAVTSEGGASEYFGDEAEYLNPLSPESIRRAAERAWNRGRLDAHVKAGVCRFTWESAGGRTVEAYRSALRTLRPDTAVAPERYRELAARFPDPVPLEAVDADARWRAPSRK